MSKLYSYGLSDLKLKSILRRIFSDLIRLATFCYLLRVFHLLQYRVSFKKSFAHLIWLLYCFFMHRRRACQCEEIIAESVHKSECFGRYLILFKQSSHCAFRTSADSASHVDLSGGWTAAWKYEILQRWEYFRHSVDFLLQFFCKMISLECSCFLLPF